MTTERVAVQHHDPVLISGILLGLVLGLLSGGRLTNLASIQLRWTGLLVAAVAIRFGTEAALGADIGIVESLRLPLLVSGFSLLLAALWVNRGYPGLSLAFLGVLSNAIAIVVNGGLMPVWAAQPRCVRPDARRRQHVDSMSSCRARPPSS